MVAEELLKLLTSTQARLEALERSLDFSEDVLQLHDLDRRLSTVTSRIVELVKRTH